MYTAILLSCVIAVAGQSSVTDYAPRTNVQCPGTPLLREFTPQNQTLHPQETHYITQRESTILPAAWEFWLGNASAIGYNFTAFVSHLPRVGIAFSGGGFRAAQYGAGVAMGLDARNTSSKAAGTGGLLQVASYIAGLSGGSWLTGSLIMNDWPTVPDLVFGNNDNLNGWSLDLDLIIPGGINLFSQQNQAFFGSILWSVISKAKKGIDTSITDPWARMISYHFLSFTTRDNFFTNDSSHGAGQLWSQVPLVPSYQRYSVPFPIIYANSRPKGFTSTGILPLDATVYEISPLEFGSWDPALSAMVNTTYIGTHLSHGQPPNSTACVTGFDEVGFMMGTSASLFNQLIDASTAILSGFSPAADAGLNLLLNRQLREVRTRANDVANWPSPFNGIKNDTFHDSNATWIELIDGSSNLENMPLSPLLVKARALDVVVAVDASSDTSEGWPNGTSFLHTSQRIKTLLSSSHQPFPPIPDSIDAFLSTGVNMRPTFFGCYPTNNPPEYPLVISLPNSPPINGDSPVTNSDTFKISYSPKHTRLFLDQVYKTTTNGFIPNANIPDPNWGRCLQCAAVDRARFKMSPIPVRSPICQQCFVQYCFDPQNPPSKSQLPGRQYDFFDPDPAGFAQVETLFTAHKMGLIGGLIGLFVFLALLIAGLHWWKKRRERRHQYYDLDTFHEDESPEYSKGDSNDNIPSSPTETHRDSTTAPV